MLFTKLSIFYFTYFALLGAMAPYLGVYLESKDFSLIEISQLTALLMFTKVLAPNIWGHLADYSGKRLALVRVGAFATMLSYFGFFYASTFWQFAFVIALFSFFWNAVLAQFEVVTLYNLSEHHQKYSRIRLWGSVGFIVAVSLLGYVFEYAGVQLFPVALMVIIAAISLASLQRFDEPIMSDQVNRTFGAFARALKRREVWVFFAVCFLLQLSHGSYYTYFTIYLEKLSYTKSTIGWLWALGVLAEVVLFLVMHRWLARHRDDYIMLVALALTALRWFVIALGANNFVLLLFAQVLHAFSFGAMHAAAIHFVHRSFDLGMQGKAQAFYSSVGYGLGGAIGALVSGSLVAYYSYSASFFVSACFVVMAFVLLCLNRRHFA